MMKKVLLVLLLALVIIQFIRPAKNVNAVPFPNDITQRYPMPDSVHAILAKACYDCHSSNTTYPWYDQVQPVYWWVTKHIHDGKRHLNFNDFLSMRPNKQFKRIKGSIDAINEGWMPISSYTLVHGDARLTDGEKKTVTDWLDSVRDRMKTEYPADSLKSPEKKKEH